MNVLVHNKDTAVCTIKGLVRVSVTDVTNTRTLVSGEKLDESVDFLLFAASHVWLI